VIKIKICGLFSVKDIEIVNYAKPDYIGFVFVPDSKRYITPDKAEQLHHVLDKSISAIGVFQNFDADEIISIYKRGIIDMAQLHGDETPEVVLKVKAWLPVIKAISMKPGWDTEQKRYKDADYFLLDSGSGGTGKAFDWKLIGESSKPYFLAGGINTENISSALKLNPFAVDVSSGAETNARKDAKKVYRLIQTVRGLL
jgi:phosphoribosylanthranilate isomerase